MTLTQLAVSLVEAVAGPQHGEDSHARDRRAALIARAEAWLRERCLPSLDRRLAGLEEDVLGYLDRQLAAAEGRALGWRMRALLAEDAIQDVRLEWETRLAEQETAVEAWQLSQLERMRERNEGYAIGHRDGLGVGAHRDALVADVLEAARCWRIAAMLKADTRMERYEQLERATDRLLAAERPGLGDGR